MSQQNMKTILLSTLFIACFAITNSSSAQTIPGLFPRYNYSDNSENTSDFILLTNRLKNFQIVIDDSVKHSVLGKPVFTRFAIRNVPVGNHTIVVLQNKLWPYKERYKYGFTIQSNGDGGKIFVVLPKRRYCNAYKIVNGAIVAACGVWIYLFNENWTQR
jgi:hypothetical protein